MAWNAHLRYLSLGQAGLVGEALVFRLLVDKRFKVVAAVRGATRLLGLCTVEPFDLTQPLLLPSLGAAQVVVHAAAWVHVMKMTRL